MRIRLHMRHVVLWAVVHRRRIHELRRAQHSLLHVAVTVLRGKPLVLGRNSALRLGVEGAHLLLLLIIQVLVLKVAD